MKLSVIVTVYNREKYLARCLDSILCQDLDEYEIIVIDDGSSDGSWPMIENYRERYPEKIQAFHQANAGVSRARNAGLSRAQGEYIAFVDSDDWLKENCFGTIYREAKSHACDILLFDEENVYADGTKKTPIMLHRVVYGSVERFIGILIEHFGGHFPLWLAPRQFVVIPVHHEKHVEYANKVCDALTELGMRATVDSRNEKLGYRVREAQLQKVTYQIVVGDGEQENNTVTIRQSGKKESVTLSLDEALAKFKAEVDNKTLFGK